MFPLTQEPLYCHDHGMCSAGGVLPSVKVSDLGSVNAGNHKTTIEEAQNIQQHHIFSIRTFDSLDDWPDNYSSCSGVAASAAKLQPLQTLCPNLKTHTQSNGSSMFNAPQSDQSVATGAPVSQNGLLLFGSQTARRQQGRATNCKSCSEPCSSSSSEDRMHCSNQSSPKATCLHSSRVDVEDAVKSGGSGHHSTKSSICHSASGLGCKQKSAESGFPKVPRTGIETSAATWVRAGTTTLMIQNLPNDCCRDHIIAALEKAGFGSPYSSKAPQYDYVYVPTVFHNARRRKTNFAFVNFTSEEAAMHFSAAWTSSRYFGRRIRITRAHIQGQANLQRWIGRDFMKVKNPVCRPFVAALD